MTAFHGFLKTEFSEENLEFWLACEDYKKTHSKAKLGTKANRIFEEFVQNEAPREVSMNSAKHLLSLDNSRNVLMRLRTRPLNPSYSSKFMFNMKLINNY